MLSSNRGSGVSLLASRGRSGKKTPRARRRRTNRGRRRPTTTSNPTDDDRRLANASSGTVIPPISATLGRPQGREGRPLSTRDAAIRLGRRSIDLFTWETKDRDSSAVFEVAVVAGKPTVTGFSDWDGPAHGPPSGILASDLIGPYGHVGPSSPALATSPSL
jgi:hypothetical protein